MTQSDEVKEQLSAILRDMEAESQRHGAQMTAYIQHFQEVWLQMGGDVTPPPERVLFASPVTGKVGDVFGVGWFAAVNFAEKYGALGHYHTGVDLNLPGYADAGKPVMAAANGRVVFAGHVGGWQGDIVIIEHVLEDASKVWTRYAHINATIGTVSAITRGEVIGTIADYTPTGKPEGDHLHYDVSHKDLGATPDDWPGNALGRVYADYVDPVKWHKARAV
jgi:murein DD-endopeptidase MepM/ murein hydrolase activator NlpD